MTVPSVSIGLPVYNGANFVADAIESLLDQTYGDFELIICDNASGDDTERICRAYADHDSRIRYFRNEMNIGAAPNYNRTFALSRGRYFKWAAHDDCCLPDFLRRCVEVLDEHPEVVLSYPRTSTIDGSGAWVKDWPPRPELAASDPHRRLREALAPVETHPIWGLIRSDVLRQTPLFGSYPGHDLPLLAELALRGPLVEIDEILFLQREHGQRSVRVYDFRDPHRAVAWYNPSKAGKLVFPRWRLLAEYLAAIARVPLSPGERARSCRELIPWLRSSAGSLLADVVVAAARIPGIGPWLKSGHERCTRWSEIVRWRRVANQIAEATSPEDLVILIGEPWLGDRALVPRRTLPFLEKDGDYFGFPLNDDQAIAELERMRDAGARTIAFAWQAFWWFDHYDGFRHYLDTKFHRVMSSKQLVIFDLRSARPVSIPDGSREAGTIDRGNLSAKRSADGHEPAG